MGNKICDFFKKMFYRAFSLSFFAFVAFVLLTLTVAYAVVPMDGEKELHDGIIRLHVLANSDTEKDQQLKLLVRDAVIEYTSGLLSECSDISEAKKLISENREGIVCAAKRVIDDNGCNYKVTLDCGFETYPRKSYGIYTFPAGNYYSLKIKIGKAQGKNWWCVLFPPMCLGGAVAEKYEDAGELSKIGFSDKEIDIISEEKSTKKEIRFFFLDLFTKGK